MENASKALIIAGSVLLAIMLVAMGVTIFTRARNSADSTSLDATEISMFNQKFERFDGKRSGSNIKSLCSFAISNASTNKDDSSKLPTIYYKKGTSDEKKAIGGTTATKKIQTYIDDISNIRTNIYTTTDYNVSISYGTSGLIETIEIE